MGYVKLPDGSIITTTSGLINTTSAEAGAIIYYVPKSAIQVSISESSVYGDLRTNRVNAINFTTNFINSLRVPFSKHVTVTYGPIDSLYAPKAIEVYAGYCLGLISLSVPLATTVWLDNSLTTKLYAPKAVNVDSTDGALSAQSIGDILYQAYVENRQGVSFTFLGGTNATETQVETYMESNYSGFNYSSIGTWLSASGGTLTINA